MNRAIKFWDRQSRNYDKTESKIEQLRVKVVEKSKKYLNASDIVLDYGCGTGTITCEIAETVKEIRGIDISAKMIERPKEKQMSAELKTYVLSNRGYLMRD
jgi:ubiquinone/menaquinone biosynthesis C-methylase UbiE